MKVTQTAANVIDDNNTSQPIAESESRLTTQSANWSWANVNLCWCWWPFLLTVAVFCQGLVPR